MPKAVLKISVPEEMWIAELSREHAIEELRILSAIPSGATGVAVAELTASKPESIVGEIRSIESVVTADVLEVEENRTLLQLETRLPLLLNAARESGVPVAMPFIVRDGEVTWEVTASRDRLSELGQQLEAFGVQFQIESIYQRIDSERFLSEQQWNVLSTAIELGYYDTPRTCTQYELAEAVGVANSTCSETLHRAEEQVIKRFVDVAAESTSPVIVP